MGDIRKITFEQMLALRKCENLVYSVAYWIFNNFNVSEVRKDGSPTLDMFMTRNRDIGMFLEAIVEEEDVRMAIYEMECDKDESEDEGCECHACDSIRSIAIN